MKATTSAAGEIGRGIVIAGMAALLVACAPPAASHSSSARPAGSRTAA